MADNYRPDQGNTASNLTMTLAAIAVFGGFIWLWLNTGGEGASKLIAVGVMGVIWIGVVFAVVGILGFVLGLAGIATRRK